MYTAEFTVIATKKKLSGFSCEMLPGEEEATVLIEVQADSEEEAKSKAKKQLAGFSYQLIEIFQ